MRIKLIKLSDLSGSKASFYSLYYNKDSKTLFRKFLEENSTLHNNEILNIYNRILSMGKDEGAKEGYFKMEEGEPGDRVCALFDIPGSLLRLYCIRYSSKLVVLGNGGPKPKKISALQDDPKLKLENRRMRNISKLIETKTSESELIIEFPGFHFEGNLELKDDYYED